MRSALYGRYSTDKQRETSIDDQLRSGRDRIEREGWALTATYADEGVSGSTPLALRAGGKALLADALAGRIEVLVLEGLDRLSREIGEQERIVKRLEHRGIRIIGTADGYDTETRGRKVMRIARGLVNELYLDDLREKTHRGMAGQVDRGLHTGGRSYGYRTEAAVGGARVVIDQVEAAIVREIFEARAAGDSVQHIVRRLNERGVPSARGGTWAVSALQGSAAQGLGMLNNEIYRGRQTWNKRQWLKDPDTGKRRYVERPREEWVERDVPELRIVSEELWAAVHTRGAPQRRRGQRISRTLFGGLLRCSACGGPVVAVNGQRYGCNAHKDRGPTVCANAATAPREKVDKRLLAEVRDELARPAALVELHAEVRQLVAEYRRESSAGADAGRRRAVELEGEISRLVDAIVQVGASEALSARLKAAEAERARLAAQARIDVGPDAEAIAASAAADYRRLLLQLQEALSAEDGLERSRQGLATLLGPIVLSRDDAGWWAEMEEPAERMLVHAFGGSVSSTGCGGRIHRVSTLPARLTLAFQPARQLQHTPPRALAERVRAAAQRAHHCSALAA